LKNSEATNSTWYIDEKVVYTVQGMDSIISICFLALIYYLFVRKRTNPNGETYRVNVDLRGWIIIISYYLSVTLSAVSWTIYVVLKLNQLNKKES